MRSRVSRTSRTGIWSTSNVTVRSAVCTPFVSAWTWTSYVADVGLVARTNTWVRSPWASDRRSVAPYSDTGAAVARSTTVTFTKAPAAPSSQENGFPGFDVIFAEMDTCTRDPGEYVAEDVLTRSPRYPTYGWREANPVRAGEPPDVSLNQAEKFTFLSCGRLVSGRTL